MLVKPLLSACEELLLEEELLLWEALDELLEDDELGVLLDGLLLELEAALEELELFCFEELLLWLFYNSYASTIIS